MNRQMLLKFAVKGIIGLGVSALIGTAIKSQRTIDEAIDSYFKNATSTNV